MGSWGHKALDSDAGLDVIDCIREYIIKTYPDGTKIDLTLKEIINVFLEEDLISEDFDDIDFYYDNTAMSIAELYLMFHELGYLDYSDPEDENIDLEKRVKSFQADKDSLQFILRYLNDIKNEVPDCDGIREIAELRHASNSSQEWDNHLNELIEKITQHYNAS